MRFYTGFGKFLRNILTHSWSLGKHTSLKVGEESSFFYLPSSIISQSRFPLDGFRFIFIAWQSKWSIYTQHVRYENLQCVVQPISTRCRTLLTHSKITTARWKALPTGWNTLQRIFNAFSTYLLCRVFASRVTIFTFGWMKNSFSWGKRLISRGGPQLITCFRTELRFTWIFSIKNAGLFSRYKYATSQFSRTISTVLINVSLLS